MTEPRLIDISQTLRPDLPTWPGGTRFASEPTFSHGPGCPVNVSRYTASTHAGTHADAPLHYDPEGAAIDTVPLEPCIGPARLLDLCGRGAVITRDLVAPFLSVDTPARILFRTCQHFPHRAWTDDFVTVSPETITLLAIHGILLIGIDSRSIDPRTAKTLTAHDAARAVLRPLSR